MFNFFIIILSLQIFLFTSFGTKSLYAEYKNLAPESMFVDSSQSELISMLMPTATLAAATEDEQASFYLDEYLTLNSLDEMISSLNQSQINKDVYLLQDTLAELNIFYIQKAGEQPCLSVWPNILSNIYNIIGKMLSCPNSYSVALEIIENYSIDYKIENIDEVLRDFYENIISKLEPQTPLYFAFEGLCARLRLASSQADETASPRAASEPLRIIEPVTPPIGSLENLISIVNRLFPKISPLETDYRPMIEYIEQMKNFYKSQRYTPWQPGITFQQLSQLVTQQINFELGEGVDRKIKAIPKGSSEVKTYSLKMHSRATYLPLMPGGKILYIGDLHGNYEKLLKILQQTHFIERVSAGENVHLVFLGDVMDRGQDDNELKALATLLKLKQSFPNNVTLLRGNHETRAVNLYPNSKLYNILCSASTLSSHIGKPDYRIVLQLMEKVNEVFDELPSFLITGNGQIAMHGGPLLGFQTAEQGLDRLFQEAGTIRNVSFLEDGNNLLFSYKTHQNSAQIDLETLRRMGASLIVKGHDHVSEYDPDSKICIVASGYLNFKHLEDEYSYLESVLEEDISSTRLVFFNIGREPIFKNIFLQEEDYGVPLSLPTSAEERLFLIDREEAADYDVEKLLEHRLEAVDFNRGDIFCITPIAIGPDTYLPGAVKAISTARRIGEDLRIRNINILEEQELRAQLSNVDFSKFNRDQICPELEARMQKVIDGVQRIYPDERVFSGYKIVIVSNLETLAKVDKIKKIIYINQLAVQNQAFETVVGWFFLHEIHRIMGNYQELTQALVNDPEFIGKEAELMFRELKDYVEIFSEDRALVQLKSAFARLYGQGILMTSYQGHEINILPVLENYGVSIFNAQAKTYLTVACAA